MMFDIPFSHIAPDHYFYSFEEYKPGVTSIWLNRDSEFDYILEKPSKCIWGFYSHKKKKYFAPVNSKTIGKEVKFENTRNWSSMPIKQSPLDAFFI